MQSTSSVSDVLTRLRAHIEQVPVRLRALSEAELTQQAPDKWSRKEIVGHLIDSAINNLKRFTDAQFANGTYQLQPYNQNQLVRVNHYQALPMDHLLSLWTSLNTQILYVAEAIPADTLTHLIQLGQPASETRTLAWLIEDYVVHLEHHIKTVV
ncbi:DinB family protein [Spirosoma jeollabukense]